MKVWDNRHQPYPTQSQIVDCALWSTPSREVLGCVYDGSDLGGTRNLEEEVAIDQDNSLSRVSHLEGLVSGPLWPNLNHNSKRVTLYGLCVPVPGNRLNKRIAQLSLS